MVDIILKQFESPDEVRKFDKGKFEESAELYKKYINKVKKNFGPESSHLIDPTNELAITYAELNKPDLAIENYLKAIYINTNLNGEFNENNGIFYENLSITNWEVNKYSAAVKNIKRSWNKISIKMDKRF